MKRLLSFVLIISLTFFAMYSLMKSNTFVERHVTVFAHTPELPFPTPSSISQEIDNVRVGLEKIVSEKYFIIYSTMIGDQSYFGIHLIIENTKMEELFSDRFQLIRIIDDKGNVHQPVPYHEIYRYPKDSPLEWKLMFFGKFPPLTKDIEKIEIVFKYDDKVFNLKDIPVNN